VTYYVLFFIHLESRKVDIAGITVHPNERWMQQMARNVTNVALTLIEAPQYYEPLFFKRDVKGRAVSIIDEWCCGYVKGLALDSLGWQPLIEARPDWFEVIHLATGSRLKLREC
jgi:uncharacterized protein YecA (UPF0149 family)